MAEAPNWYPEMEVVTGVTLNSATFEDFQREFKCKDIWKAECNDKGLQFPSTCSYPPCNQCTVEEGWYIVNILKVFTLDVFAFFITS